jgi:hypothetical protein
MKKITSRLLPIFLITISILACSATTGISSNNGEKGISTTQAEPQNTEPTPTIVYLPVVRTIPPKFIGYIDKIYWSQENVEKYMPEADQLAGLQHTAVGWFIDIQDPAFYEDWETEPALNRNNLYRQLERLWEKGYFSFIKIGSTDTAQSIVDGKYDANISQMASIYRTWVEKGAGRRAMLAPLQEMNGDWVKYYSSEMTYQQKQNIYKQAYRKIQQIFELNGVDRDRVWWVFAANGLSAPDVPENNFEYYYPGNDTIDIVGFASYNYGFCPASDPPGDADYGRWENYDTLFEPYIRRLEKMAPGKPIIITETGTSAIYTKADRPDNYNYSMKAEWFKVNYSYLSQQSSLLGIFYFDISEFDGTTCDLRIPRDFNFTAYQEAVNQFGYEYLTNDRLTDIIP